MLDNRTMLVRSVAILTALAEVGRPVPESFVYIPFSEDGLDAFYLVIGTMERCGWIKRGAGPTIAITPKGRETAERVEATVAARKATVAKPKEGA